MTADPPAYEPLRPVSRRKLAGAATLVVLLSAGVMTALWWLGTRGLTGSDLVAARFDAVKIGLSIGAGGGGLFVLYLGWRRQRSTEADLDNRERTLLQQRHSADATQADATERRITELYTKGVEQLGSDKAPVRLGGLYGLERLAQDYPLQRQTIVNVLCAYLRMPETKSTEDDAQQRLQEREVRMTAQRILGDHLRDGTKFWPGMEIDLTGARLLDLDLSGCHVRKAQFKSTVFTGTTTFRSAAFAEDVFFEQATLAADADFRATSFAGNAFFSGADFTGDAFFTAARFTRSCMFESAAFRGDAVFESAEFGTATSFEGATFARGVPMEITRYVPTTR